ncbi:DUF6493 family protein [Klebsiella aerogenes]|uniref:DUF6493 family protein n=1 Tax=Klebsiella aerogenes TaxID=548 RepID=UPI002277D2C0|nr:DUF6493 family protein [Klebsiella aerogenes]MCY4765018.1 DUF6493 family protein [Klebsiella aerogenes]
MIEYKEKYSKYITSGNAEQLNNWLQKLDEKTRKTLVPQIKNDLKRLYLYQVQGDGRWARRATSGQCAMLAVAVISCYSRKDIKSIPDDLFYNNTSIEQTISWRSPEWLTDYINSFRNREGSPFSYRQLCDWLVAGYIYALDPEIVARTLVSSFIDEDCHKITCDEHIWALFNHPCDIAYYDCFFPNQDRPEGAREEKWLYLFAILTQSQRIDRLRVLKESLLAVNRNFKRDQTNWFATLFSALKPSVEECIQLQDELFAAFACPQSKPVSTALAAIKTVVDHPQFRVDEFTAQLPLLFASPGKGVITTSLAVTDKIAAKKPELRAEVSRYICGVFLNKDVGLQTKAAKLLVKYGDATDPQLSALLMDYADNLLVAARELLTDFLDVQPAMNEAEETFLQPLIREDNRIVEPQRWEDFVFLAGQAFLNLESWHFDLLPAAVLRFDSMVTEENVGQLEPAFAQAVQVSEHYSPTTGYLDTILAAFFLQYGCTLIERFPQQTHSLQQMREQHKCMSRGLSALRSSQTVKYYPYIDLLESVLSQLRYSGRLPLLSTPTHTPCFIDSSALIDRLSQYQKAGVTPCSLDMQLAIQRCALNTVPATLSNLTGEYAALMKYLLHGELDVLALIPQDEWKLAAIITRSASAPDVGSFDAGYALLEKLQLPAELLTNLYPWHVEVKQQRQRYSKSEITNLQFAFDFAKHWRLDNITLFYEYGFIKSHSHSYDYGPDKRRAIYSFPWFYETTLARFLEKGFATADIKEVKPTLEMLQALFDLPLSLSGVGNLLIALAMLHRDKTVRSLAGELWIDKCRRPDGVNSAVIGDALGRLEAQGWAPLKRFTDLAMQSLMGVSARHNAALLEMVNAMASHLDGVKISNYKKLVELRQELTRM